MQAQGDGALARCVRLKSSLRGVWTRASVFVMLNSLATRGFRKRSITCTHARCGREPPHPPRAAANGTGVQVMLLAVVPTASQYQPAALADASNSKGRPCSMGALGVHLVQATSGEQQPSGGARRLRSRSEPCDRHAGPRAPRGVRSLSLDATGPGGADAKRDPRRGVRCPQA